MSTITIKISRNAIGFTHFLKAIGYNVDYGSVYAVNGIIVGYRTEEHYLISGLLSQYKKTLEV